MKKLFFTSLIVVFLHPISSLAYKTPQHKQLSEFAAFTYNQCALIPLTRKQINTLKKYNAGEDNFITKIPQRIVNWHFYNLRLDSPALFKHPLGFSIDRSMRGLLSNIEKSIIKNSVNEKLIGSALHFVEDVTVPAHVAPAFHGPLILGMEKSTDLPQALLKNYFWGIEDSIDSWPIAAKRIKETLINIIDQPAFCKKLIDSNLFISVDFKSGKFNITYDKLNSNNHFLSEIINATALKTTSVLIKHIPDSTEKWQWFWPEQKNTFFTLYPMDDKAKIIAFGDKLTLGGKKMTKKIYDDFVYERHIQAILSGAKLISLMKSHTL